MTIDDELAKMGWRSNPNQVSVPLNPGIEIGKMLMGAGSPELRNIGRGLPAVSETTPAPRTPNSDHATVVTIAEAASRTGVSVQTWRWRLKAGQVAGAYKTAGAQGETWQIPVTALDTIAVGKAVPVVSAASETISDLETKLATLESQLAVQRALADERLMMLNQLRATVRALNGGITKAKSKLRWWRKS